MKLRYIFSFVIVATALALMLATLRKNPTSAQPQPRRLVSGDTLWYEIDSLPVLPSSLMIYDSISHRWILPSDRDRQLRTSPVRVIPERIPFDYEIPYWSVYRRSVTLWGITFSTGQASPFAPYVYPSEDYPDAEVLSFPLNRPR